MGGDALTDLHGPSAPNCTLLERCPRVGVSTPTITLWTPPPPPTTARSTTSLSSPPEILQATRRDRRRRTLSATGTSQRKRTPVSSTPQRARLLQKHAQGNAP